MVPVLPPVEDPSCCSSNRFDHVPRIHRINYCLYPQKAALVHLRRLAWDRVRHVLLRSQGVRLPRKSPQVKDCKEGHLDAQQHRGDSNFDVRRLELIAGGDGTCRGKESDSNRLPKAEKDHQLNCSDLEKRLVLGNISFDLNVELNETVHGDRDGARFDENDPNVGEGRIEGLEAVSVEDLGRASNNSHEDSDEAVLEDGDPDDLGCQQRRSLQRIQLTLNQVSPLLGVLQMPLSPPQHFCSQPIGQIHFLGVIVRKYSFWACKSCAT